jgi:hypothetical protein
MEISGPRPVLFTYAHLWRRCAFDSAHLLNPSTTPTPYALQDIMSLESTSKHSNPPGKLFGRSRHPNKPGEPLAVTKETTAWEIYNHKASGIDKEMIKDWNDNLNTLLIFVSQAQPGDLRAVI